MTSVLTRPDIITRESGDAFKKQFDVPIIIAEKRDFRHPIADSQHVLNRRPAGKHGRFLIHVGIGIENADDAETAVRDVVVGVLAHQDDPLTEPGIQFVREFQPDHDSLVVLILDHMAFDNGIGDERNLRFCIRVDAEQSDSAGLTLTRDHCWYVDAPRPGSESLIAEGRFQLSATRGNQIVDARIIAKFRMMNLHVAGQCLNAIAQHVVDHAAHQCRHENHRPDADSDGRHHDYRAAVIAPEIAPGQCRKDFELAHHAALIASTGCSQCNRRAGYRAETRVPAKTTAGPIRSVSMPTSG
jgi:hypothetical protein